MRGNIFFALFAAVGMVGAVGYGFNTVIRGPITSMSDVTRRTVTENYVITASRVAIVNATTQQANGGDCDADGMIEPLPYRAAGGAPAPVGGGLIPTGLVPDTTDPWNVEYGYCAWDAGSLSVSDAVPGCGGASPRRLEGSPLNNQYAIAVISAGKDKKFDTRCNAYVDTTPADNLPDTPLLVKTAGSDDVVLAYTYAEANDLGNGLWKEKTADPTTLQTDKNVESTGGATFSDKVTLTGNTATGGGLVLPGDPGDDSLSGPCNAANERQLRRNTATSPPVLEVCDYNGGAGLGWTPVSGTGGGGGPADCTGLGNGHYNDASTGHCYFFSQTNRTRADSVTYCQSEGAYPVAINSSTENSLLWNNLTQETSHTGMSDLDAEGVWEYDFGELTGTQFWSGDQNGSAVGGRYNNWESGDPNGSTVDNCLLYGWNGNNLWVDHGCGALENVICEKTGSPAGSSGGGTTDAPVSRWKLDETAGTTATDSVGGNHGTVSGATTWQPSAGQHNGALQFNAGGGKVEAPRTAALEPSAVTLSAWVKRNGAQVQWATIASKGWNGNTGPTYHSYALQFNDNSDDTIVFITGASSSVHNLSSTASILPDNTWVHIAGTYDPNGAAPQKNLYINGTLNASATLTDDIVYANNNSSDFSIGEEETNNAEFVGAIDDVRVYNRALTATEVQTIYTATLPPQPTLKKTNKPGRLFSWASIDTSEQLGNGVGALGTVAPYALVNGDGFVQAEMSGLGGCGVRSDGTVWCWGTDGNGQLGNGATTGNQGVMTQAVGITNAVKVSTTIHQSCALLSDGQIMCWGSNSVGQLGIGSATPTNSQVPVKATTYSDFIDVATAVYSSSSTTCGLRYSGAVFCWGEGSGGELGNGASVDSVTPVQVSNVSNFVKITGSSSSATVGAHFCGITKTGEAYCWGSEKGAEFGNGATGSSNVPSPVSTFTDWVDIATLNTVTCGVRANGLGYCWGTESSGNLGNGATSTAQATPVPIDSSMTFRKIEPSLLSSCGIATNNTLYCWGSNASGQMGRPSLSTGPFTSPIAVNGRNVIDISMSSNNFLVIMDEGATDAVVADKNLNMIVAGNELACGIIKDGVGICAGDDTNGELGNGATSGTQTIGTEISGTGPWMQLTASPSNAAGHACGIKNDGSAWCWGYGANGQIGNGGTSNQTAPVVVDNAARKWSQIAAGGAHTCGIETDGDLFCWGNGYGNTPVAVGVGRMWTSISAGQNNTCGIDRDGAAWCWGDDTLGQLGNGSATTGTQTNPVQVASSGFWVNIAAGPISCGIKSNGTLWCWGDLTSAAITGWDNTVPQLMMDIGPWAKVKTNYRNVCGIKTNGSLWCFGEGSGYVNGNNNTADFSYPQLVLGGGNYIDLSVGYDQACAGRSDFTAYCWGLTSTRPTRVELTPQAAGFAWNTADNAILPPAKLSATIGTTRWISDDGAANKGFNLGTSGTAQVRQSVSNQLLVETKGAGFDAQATLRAPSAVTSGDIQDGLIRHFMLNETTGSTITDAKGGGNGTWSDGSGNSVAEETVPGVNGTALNFDGTDDRVSISNFSPPPQGTIAVWVRFDNLTESRFIGGNSTFQIMHEVGSDNIESDIGLANGPFSPNPASTGTWYHVAVNWTSARTNLYVNGNLIAYEDNPVIPSGPFTLYIGDSNTGTNHDGAIDDVRIYNRALDPGEIAQLYNYTQGSVITRSVGVDANNGNFEIVRNNPTGTKWLSSTAPDIEINEDGNVGIGTSGAPAAKLDVNGAIRVGNETTCNGASEGTIRWTGTAMEYCDGSWQPLTSANTGGGGGGGGILSLWNTMGDGFSMIRGDGTAGTWGYGDLGRLGNNSVADLFINESGTVCSSSSCGMIWADWALIASGDTSCGIRTNGGAWCWGYGEWGQIGDGDYNDFMLPTPVRDTADTSEWYDWVHVQTGGDVSCGIRTSGTAYCWGNSGNGELGNGASSGLFPTPQPVHSSTNPYTPWTDWKTVEPNPRTTAGIRANGEAYAWGIDTYGLGNQPSTSAIQSRPLVVKSTGGGAQWTDWKDISAGGGTICGIRANGLMYCWGEGAEGQLGNAGWNPEDYPILTDDSNCSTSGTDRWIDVATGNDHTCAVKAGGTLWCWGRAAEGQAGNNDAGASGGDGNNGNNYCMQQVLDNTGGAGWSDWVSVRTPWNTTCGMRANGTVWCWGEGASATGTDAPLPVQVQ